MRLSDKVSCSGLYPPSVVGFCVSDKDTFNQSGAYCSTARIPFFQPQKGIRITGSLIARFFSLAPSEPKLWGIAHVPCYSESRWTKYSLIEVEVSTPGA